jgi:hypothetical protein
MTEGREETQDDSRRKIHQCWTDSGEWNPSDGRLRQISATAERRLKPGTVLVRECQGERHTVTVVPNGYVWHETTYASLSIIARAITGTAWNGPRFFGLRACWPKANCHRAYARPRLI